MPPEISYSSTLDGLLLSPTPDTETGADLPPDAVTVTTGAVKPCRPWGGTPLFARLPLRGRDGDGGDVARPPAGAYRVAPFCGSSAARGCLTGYRWRRPVGASPLAVATRCCGDLPTR